MRRTSQDTRHRILKAAYGLLYARGFTRVSMDDIAATAEITKRTLYNHFASKDQLVAEMLADQHCQALESFKAWANPEATSPAEFATSLFDAFAAWAQSPRWLASGFTRISMELADLPGHPARTAASNHKKALEDWLAGEFATRGARNTRQLAAKIMLLTEGCMSLVLIHRNTTYITSAAAAAQAILRDH